MRHAFATAVLAALVCAAPVRADILAACGDEIGRYCADVAAGRGRIAACLIGNDARLGAGCQPEVRALAARAGRNMMVPGEVRRLLDPAFRADLPASCARDAARLCNGVAPQAGPLLACLYARSDRVDPACSTDARRVTSTGN